MITGPWPNRHLLLLPLSTANALVTQGMELARGTGVNVRTTPQVARPADAWNFISSTWTRLREELGPRVAPTGSPAARTTMPQAPQRPAEPALGAPQKPPPPRTGAGGTARAARRGPKRAPVRGGGTPAPPPAPPGAGAGSTPPPPKHPPAVLQADRDHVLRPESPFENQ